MSRWADAFHAATARRDTSDTCDTRTAEEPAGRHVSPTVPCVTGADSGSGLRGWAPTLAPATPEQLADEAADREAVAAEPLLPAPGTPERDRHDRTLGEMIAGLIRASRAHRDLKLPPQSTDGDAR